MRNARGGTPVCGTVLTPFRGDLAAVFRRGEAFELAERARDVLDVGEAQLGGRLGYAQPFAQQLHHLFDASLDDVIVDRGAHALFETGFEQAARQGYQLHQIVHRDLLTDVLMDVAQYLGDVRVVVGIDVRRLSGDDIERHHHDVFPFRFGVADQPVDQPCHVVAALLDALAERRKVRGGELADRLVVVYPQDGYVVGDARISPPPRSGGTLR